MGTNGLRNISRSITVLHVIVAIGLIIPNTSAFFWFAPKHWGIETRPRNEVENVPDFDRDG